MKKVVIVSALKKSIRVDPRRAPCQRCASLPPQALEEMNGKTLEGERIEIVFAKPPDQKRKDRKAQRQQAKTPM